MFSALVIFMKELKYIMKSQSVPEIYVVRKIVPKAHYCSYSKKGKK